MRSNRIFLFEDTGISVLSVLVAIVLPKTNVLISIISATREMELIGTFIAGMFFTSIFTTAPAIATLGELAQQNSVIVTALVGALGAVTGDLIIFRFVRDRFSKHLATLLSHSTVSKRLRALFHLRFFRWFTVLFGGLIIASPLPDEIGISILGFSKMGVKWFIPVSFIFNFIGILIIGYGFRNF